MALSTGGQITGTPTASGTFNFTVQVKDSTNATATANLSITVSAVTCVGGSESKLNGQYAFALQGFNGVNSIGIGGIFDADGLGHIAKTVGIVDVNDSGSTNPVLNQTINSAASSYTVGADGRGCMTLAFGGTNETFRFSLGNFTAGVASTGHIIQFSGKTTTGILRKQDPTAFSLGQINGNFAFGASGGQPGGSRYAVAGTFAASGGVISAGQADTNDHGNVDNTNGTFTYPPTPIAFTGTYTINANGTGTLSVAGGSVNFKVYVVSASELLMLSTDVQSTNGLAVGTVLRTNQASFTASSLNAPGILYGSSLGYNGGASPVGRSAAGIFTPNGTGSFTFAGYHNSGGTIQADSASGTYSVASNGRVTFFGTGGGSTPILYLVSPNQGFVLFTDPSLTNPKVDSGLLEPQTGAPFTNGSASGPYAFGTVWPTTTGVSDKSGVATFATPNINGTQDKNSGGTLTVGQTFTATYSIDATGLGLIPSGCSVLGGTCKNIFYIISPTKAVLLEVDPTSTQPGLQIADK